MSLVSLEQIRKMAALIDPREKLDADVEMMIQDMATEFIKDATGQACKLARHRGSDTVGVEDVMLPVDLKHKIKVPGYNQDVIPMSSKPGVRKLPTRNHAAIASSIRASVANESKKAKERKTKGKGIVKK